jgi:hypothetical protein
VKKEGKPEWLCLLRKEYNCLFDKGANTMGAFTARQRLFGGLLLILACAGVLLLTATARAELLANDGHALDGWHGTSHVVGEPFVEFLTDKLVVDIDYAVYEPGNFNLSFPGADPSSNLQYVYAYQFFNDLTSTDYISVFTLGLDGDETPSNIGWIEEDPENPSGVAPDSSAFGGTENPTSAVWSYDYANRVIPTEKSKILIFTSPFGPQTDFASLVGGSSGGSAPDGLPSPVPEPAALLSLAVFGGLFILIKMLHASVF